MKRGFAMWAHSDFKHKPTKEEVERIDPIWDNDLNTYLHFMNWVEGLEALESTIEERGNGY